MTTEFTPKQTSEAYAIAFDFTPVLGTEIIQTATIMAVDQITLVDVSTTFLDVTKQSNSNTVVYGWVRDGISGHSYLITCNIVGISASEYELEALLPVADTPDAAISSGNSLIVGPAIEPITLAELKIHLKIGSDSTENDLLNELIVTARLDVENDTRRAIITQIWDYCPLRWPDTDRIKIPLGNLQTVVQVKYKESDWASIADDKILILGTDYLIETNSDQCGFIVLPYGGSWPSVTLFPSNPITIRFIAGWTTTALVPSTIKSAIKMRCAKLWRSRGDDIIGQTVVLDKTYARLINNVPRLYDEFL